MHWENIQTHYQSIFSLIVLCTAFMVPILVFINPISNWMTSFENINDIQTTSKGMSFFTILSILNIPLIFTILNRQKAIIKMYLFVYLLLSTLLFLLNPFNVLNTYHSVWLMAGITLVLFGTMKYFTQGILKEFILVILTILLSVSGENVLTFNSFKYSIPYMVFYGMGYLWNMMQPSIKSPSPVMKSTFVKPSWTMPSIPRSLLGVIATIIVFFYIRTWLTKYYGGELVIHNPISLRKVSSFQISNQYQYEYTLSSWVYFDATSPGYSPSATQYTDILIYGDNVLIAYNSALNTLQVIMKNRELKQSHTIEHIPLQKWNHLVLSYANGTFDLFMNGELQKSIVTIPQSSTNDIIVGSENGVRGQMCTLMFYNKVLSIEKIHSLYSQFKDKNPPTF